MKSVSKLRETRSCAMVSERAAASRPAGQQVACERQVGRAAREDRVGRGLGLARDEVDHIDERQPRGLQALEDCGSREGAALGELGFSLFDLRGDGLGGLAAVTSGLATRQVVGLDRRGAFVDREDLRIALVLRRARLLDEAHAPCTCTPSEGRRRPGSACAHPHRDGGATDIVADHTSPSKSPDWDGPVPRASAQAAREFSGRP